MRKERSTHPYEVKLFPAFFITKADKATGIVEAIVSVTGVTDYHDGIIVTGAFKKTIAERSRKVKVLNHHNSWSIFDTIGINLELRELPRDELPVELMTQYPDATGGLWTKTQYLMDTPEGAGAFVRITTGAIDEYSIGFRCLQYEWKKMEDNRVLRLIKEVQLFEYSPVIWGANPAAATLGTKGRANLFARLANATTDMTAQAGSALKAGRKISAANAEKLQAALTGCQSALASLMDTPTGTASAY